MIKKPRMIGKYGLTPATSSHKKANDEIVPTEYLTQKQRKGRKPQGQKPFKEAMDERKRIFMQEMRRRTGKKF